MAKRVYFAFHYQNDIWRVNQVRKSWVVKEDREQAGFYDASLWEKAKKESSLALKRLINSGLDRTTVTCVLIGESTYQRPWVKYEIVKSYERANKIVGIYIDGLENQSGKTCQKGENPFNYLALRISQNEESATVFHYDNRAWIEFADCPTISRRFEKGTAGKVYYMKDFKFKLYDWANDDGYKNFSTWIE